MDETTTTKRRTYVQRLHINFQPVIGPTMHVVRPVDTYSQAEWIAAQGHEADERDGTSTSYNLYMWETGIDSSVLVGVLPL